MAQITPTDAEALVHGTEEVALLDLREAGEYGEGHPLLAVPCPLSLLETRITALVPRRDVPVLLLDGGDGVSARAAAILVAMGYRDVQQVAGGVPGWAAAGYGLFKGVHVPSKTLGELAEAVWHPKPVTAQTLAAWQAAGTAPAFFDSRPPQEYARMRVPGARCLPNGELAHRLDAVLAADEPVVVTCAGRTRSIIGAIGLKLAGHRGEIHALENGTQGWALAGLTLEHDNSAEPFPALDAATAASSRSRAETLMHRFGIAQTDGKGAEALLAEAGRTTYLLDVRSWDEVAADPLPAAPHAPSGQLVQGTDMWIGVQRARVLLVDDTGLRAALAAFWLKQLGHEPIVVILDDTLRHLPAAAPAVPPSPATITAAQALAQQAGGSVLVDLRGSRAYRAGHVQGALWCPRPLLPALAKREAGRRLMLIGTGDDAAWAATEVAGAQVVEGGHAALLQAGAATEATPDRPSDAEAIDYLYFVHDRHDGNLDAARRYLAWEIGLVDALSPSERAVFHLIGPEPGGHA